MLPYEQFLNELITKSSKEFSAYPLKWVNPYEAQSYEECRAGIIERLGSSLNWSFLHTKPWVNNLSHGCQLCGAGLWSCLFITGRCNASCFYCPTAQNADHLPATQQFDFESPEAYAAYLNRYGFKGCSFSGGEPLLVYDRLKDYLEKIRSSCDPNLYIWLYTNGMLGSEQRFEELSALGIDEVRFDIGATGFNLGYLKKASGRVRNLTVEIPAVPHEEDRLFQLLPQLEALGVSNLNLHSLRLTHYNAHNLTRNNYTYLHGEQVVVMESELLALRIMEYVRSHNLNLGVNYCSSQYKRRFQRAGFRRLVARTTGPQDFISENGYVLRILDVHGKQIDLQRFVDMARDYSSVCIRIFGYEFNKGIGHDERPTLSQARPDIFIELSEYPEFIQLLQKRPEEIPTTDKMFTLYQYVWIEEGLRGYF